MSGGDEKEMLSTALFMIPQGIILLVILIAVGTLMFTFAGTTQKTAELSYDSFIQSGLLRAGQVDTGEVINSFELPKNYAIMQLYLDSENKLDTKYSDNRGYATKPAEQTELTKISVDDRNTYAISNNINAYTIPQLSNCLDSPCICLAKYKSCLTPCSTEQQSNGLCDTYTEYFEKILARAYPDYAGALQKNTFITHLTTGGIRYYYGGSTSLAVLDSSSCRTSNTQMCRALSLSILDGVTRQIFANQACEDQIQLIKCTSLEALELENTVLLYDSEGQKSIFNFFPVISPENSMELSYIEIINEDALYFRRVRQG